jgi:hypothetical protein
VSVYTVHVRGTDAWLPVQTASSVLVANGGPSPVSLSTGQSIASGNSTTLTAPFGGVLASVPDRGSADLTLTLSGESVPGGYVVDGGVTV